MLDPVIAVRADARRDEPAGCVAVRIDAELVSRLLSEQAPLRRDDV